MPSLLDLLAQLSQPSSTAPWYTQANWIAGGVGTLLASFVAGFVAIKAARIQAAAKKDEQKPSSQPVPQNTVDQVSGTATVAQGTNANVVSPTFNNSPQQIVNIGPTLDQVDSIVRKAVGEELAAQLGREQTDQAQAEYEKVKRDAEREVIALRRENELLHGLLSVKETGSQETSTKRQAANRLFNLGVDEHGIGRLPEAIGLYAASIRIAASVGAFNNSAVALSDLGHYEEALSAIDNALGLRRSNPDSLNNRGLILDKLHRFVEALDDYNRALKLSPDNSLILTNRGATLDHLGRYADAVLDYDNALRITPDHPGALNNRGNALRSLQKLPESLADFNLALSIVPNHPDLLNNRALTYHCLKMYNEALEDLDKAIRARPDDAEFYINRAQTLWHGGKYIEAVRDCDTCLRIISTMADARLLQNRSYALRGVSNYQLNRLTEALSDLNEALAINSNDAYSLNNRGNVYTMLGDLDKALDDYTRSIKANPLQADPHYNMSRPLIQLGRLNEAESALKRGIELAPEVLERDIEHSFFDPVRGTPLFQRIVYSKGLGFR